METVPVLHLDVPSRQWTVDDLGYLTELAEASGYRYEIVDGALVVSPGPSNDHQMLSALLVGALNSMLPPGSMALGPLDVVFDRKNVREPDIVIAAVADLRAIPRLGPADIAVAVEIVSPSSKTTDRITKPAQYAAAGIAHYWRVELDPLSLSAYELDGGVYREVGSWGAGEIAHLVEPFPVEIDVAALLPEA